VQSEIERTRRAVGKDNYPDSTWIEDVTSNNGNDIVEAYRSQTSQRLALLGVTPPCQGMSSSNPGRGKIQEVYQINKQGEKNRVRNRLLLTTIPIINELQPKVVVAENVSQILNRVTEEDGETRKILDVFTASLSNYKVLFGTVQLANYGVPQMRLRSVIVAVHKDEPWLEVIMKHGRNPWPSPTHDEDGTNGLLPWISVTDWLNEVGYEPLDASSEERSRSAVDKLHHVPFYAGDRYKLVADIPPCSGRNAYQNPCPSCEQDGIDDREIDCPHCGSFLANRPYVVDKGSGKKRLIAGFSSSYRRMHPNRPSATITTNSSHVGSDYKIHPWQNRVMSTRECADIQTVPRWFEYKAAYEADQSYMVRQVIGEALPSLFTYLHGKILAELLSSNQPSDELIEQLIHTKATPAIRPALSK